MPDIPLTDRWLDVYGAAAAIDHTRRVHVWSCLGLPEVLAFQFEGLDPFATSGQWVPDHRGDLVVALIDEVRRLRGSPPLPTVEPIEFTDSMSASDRIVATLRLGAVHEAIAVDTPAGFVTWPCPDGWVPGWLLCHPHIGGHSGDRRVRQLRNRYDTIEKDGGNYRIVEER